MNVSCDIFYIFKVKNKSEIQNLQKQLLKNIDIKEILDPKIPIYQMLFYLMAKKKAI